MLRVTSLLMGGYTMYHRKAMGTMRYSRWQGAHGGISHFYNRTAMIEEVKPNSGTPITLVDRQMMAYVHRTRERHFQLFRSYQQKTSSTECKLREGEKLRRRWHRRLQKSFISFMQFKTMKVLEEQAKLVHEFGQAAVNSALGDEWQEYNNNKRNSSGKETPRHSNQDSFHDTNIRERKFATLRRKVHTLPSINVVPKHVATMKQIHNDRFNYRWRVN